MSVERSIPISLTFLLLAQSFHFTVAQNNPFQIDIDVAQFRYDEEKNYLEVYYAFDESQLTYVESEGQFEGGILLHAIITPTSDESAVLDNVWRIPHVIANTAGLTYGNTIVGVIGIAIPIGNYTFDVESFDEKDNSRRAEITYDLPSKPFTSHMITLSDVELCSSIKKASQETDNIFYKNTMEIIPNPGKVYGDGASSFHYYVEAYNLLTVENDGDYYTTATIYDSEGNELISQKRIRSRVNESSVEIGSINITSLTGGTYRFEFVVVDSTINAKARSSKEFFIYKPGQPSFGISQVELDERFIVEYGGMTEEELDRDFNMAIYIALDAEKAQYQSLSSVEAKRRFLFEFWRHRDPTPSTYVNEQKSEYMRRVEYANSLFHLGRRDGWKSDRGRIYITYGPPDEYERLYSERGTKPYEIWHYYNIQGGVIFIFADLFGFRDYILIHSTHRDELRDDNWRLQIQEN